MAVASNFVIFLFPILFFSPKSGRIFALSCSTLFFLLNSCSGTRTDICGSFHSILRVATLGLLRHLATFKHLKTPWIFICSLTPTNCYVIMVDA